MLNQKVKAPKKGAFTSYEWFEIILHPLIQHQIPK